MLTIPESKIWKDLFQQKFTSFSKKSPCLLAYSIQIRDGEEGCLVTHVNSNAKYWFPFEFETNVKDFIAKIKGIIIKHYPIIIEEVLEQKELSPEELAIKVEKGENISKLKKYEMKVTGQRTFHIDKVLPWKDISILILDNSSYDGERIGTSYRYKMNNSLVLFLKNYRNNKYKTLQQQSEYFFQNSFLIDEIKENVND